MKFDAVVIGAGAGGCHAAARLAAAGRRTLMIDDHAWLGGRAGTEIIDGHRVNMGAIALEPGGVFEETFKLCGAPFNIREPSPATVFYLDRKVIDVRKGGLGFLLNGLTKQASRVLDQFSQARAGSLPDGRESTEEWLRRYTKNETVHAIFRNLCAAIFAMNASEIPARAFLTYFTQKGAFKRFGFHPEGTGGAWQGLADAVVRDRYAYVGVMEDLAATLCVLAALWPDHLRGLCGADQPKVHQGTRHHVSTFQPTPSDLALLRAWNALDSTLYARVRTRHLARVHTLGLD